MHYKVQCLARYMNLHSFEYSILFTGKYKKLATLNFFQVYYITIL